LNENTVEKSKFKASGDTIEMVQKQIPSPNFHDTAEDSQSNDKKSTFVPDDSQSNDKKSTFVPAEVGVYRIAIRDANSDL